MRPFRWTLLATLALATLPLIAGAQALYKTVGPDGRVVYSDQPAPAGASGKTVQLERALVSVVPGAATAAPAAGAAPADQPAAAPRGEVVLYMATWCGYCKAARAYLAKHGIAYRELDVDTPAGKAAFATLGARGVPVLLVNGQRVSGFSQPSYDAVFAARR